jgi:glycosyltransferase involved in cell wall biosynthesis
MVNITKKKIGVLGLQAPDSSNLENLGKILSLEFELDLLGNTNVNENIKKIYSIKNYTSIKGKNMVTWFLRDMINLLHYCWKEKPNILLSVQNPDWQAPLIFIFGKLFGIKTVARFSGAGFDTYKIKKGYIRVVAYFVYHWLMRLMLFCDKIICMGEEQKQHLIKYGCKPEKIRIILQPIDESLFKPPVDRNVAKLKLGWDPNKTYLLYTGTLQKRKGIDTFLKIIPDLMGKNEDFVFILVGKDDDGYTPRFRRFPLNKVKLIPPVRQRELVDFYQAADLLIHPAIDEGFPKTVLEAAACGLPIIARDIVGVGRVADKVFDTDEELIELILHNTLKPLNISKLPEKYTWKELENQYLEVFRKP